MSQASYCRAASAKRPSRMAASAAARGALAEAASGADAGVVCAAAAGHATKVRRAERRRLPFADLLPKADIKRA